MTSTKKEELVRLMEILEDSGANTLQEIVQSLNGNNHTDRCWIEGRTCRYGYPAGKLSEAPLHFCAECPTVSINIQLIQNLLEIAGPAKREMESEIITSVTDRMEEEFQTVTALLGDLAEERGSGEIIKDFIKVLDKELELGKVEIILKEEISEIFE